MDKTNVMVEFAIKGDKFNPQIITEALNITPTECWTKEIEKPIVTPSPPLPENLVRIKDPELKELFRRINESANKSDKKYRQRRKHDFSSWKIDTGYEESHDINHQIMKIYNILKDKTDILKHLREKLNAVFVLGIVINIEDNEKPGISFGAYIIDFLHEIGATIDIDMYIYS